MNITAEQVLAFRFERLGLTDRAADAYGAAGEVGLPDFPPGAALAGLAPRLEQPAPDALAEAFEQRLLVRIRAMRGAPVVVRAEDYDLFVSGMLPHDEASMRAFIGPAMTSVNAAGMSAVEAVKVVTEEATRALAKQALDRDALHAALRERLPKGLLPYCRSCDSHHVSPSLLYAVALQGRLVIFPQDKGPYLVARADRWLGRGERKSGEPGKNPHTALVRRYLRAYGPSTATDFGAWAGIGGKQAKSMWNAIEAQLSPVEVDAKHGKPARRWILAEDREKLSRTEPLTATRVRVISPGDPLLQARDRDVLVPDPMLRKNVWKNLAPAGLLLAGGEVKGLARAKKRKDALEVAIDAVGKLDSATRSSAAQEAERLAAMRGLKLSLSWR